MGGALIVQGDRSVLLEVAHPEQAEARDALVRFAELIKCPEHFHTYRITPLSLWNAVAAGMASEQIVELLERHSRYPVPQNVLSEVREQAGRYGRLVIERNGDGLLLRCDEELLADELWHTSKVRKLLEDRIEPTTFRIDPEARGALKQALVKLGFPPEDLAGYTAGESLEIELAKETGAGDPFELRPYQRAAAEAFYGGGGPRGGSGVVVLPCGAGKTIVGLAAMSRVDCSTLILTTGNTAVKQWLRELEDKTRLTAEQLGEYTSSRKELAPVTVTTYQMVTWRREKGGDFPHFHIFADRDWGLVIYDEVHLLPAPVFSVTAGIQARRRLGLTATLVREDGCEEDVFALVGPKRYDLPWKELEREGWIAQARCHEVRLPLPEAVRARYSTASQRRRFRIAAENPAKLELVEHLLARHPDTPALVIGLYLSQLRELSERLDIPLLTGKTRTSEREQLYQGFRSGAIPVLAVSKVANFAVDLPEAGLAIQISGTWGSRQEEAQRLGRLLRPKEGDNQADFYSLVSRDTVEQDYALNRQLFLTEQGYSYRVVDGESLSRI